MEPTQTQIVDFQQRGHLAIGPLLQPSEIDLLRRAFEEQQRGWAAQCSVPLAEYERVVSQWTGLWERHPAFAQQIHHPRVEAIARRLLGAERLQLFHDHLISKPPRHSDTIPWHQDYPFWPVSEPRALSCWIPLDDATVEAGALTFMPGAHREGEQSPVDFLRAPKDWGDRAGDAVAVPVPAGWGVFHSCLSWHASPPNRTEQPRRAFIAIYMDARCRYHPTHARWHPMNERVSVAAGERFNEDRFPLIRLAGPTDGEGPS